MKILHITRTVTAYAPARFVDLINKYTDHQAKLVQIVDFHIGNPLNVDIIRSNIEIEKALDWCDIIHFHGCEYYRAGNISGISFDKYKSKPKIFHFHGSPYRERFKENQDIYPLIVSTPEMLKLFDRAIYFPNLIDEENSLYKKRERTDIDKIKICHHFSMHPHLKDTDAFIDIKNRFYFGKNKTFDLQYIPRMDMKKTIEERSSFDAVFDHIQGYYGLVSIEAMSQGIIAINSCSDECMVEIRKFFGEYPPFYRVFDKDSLLRRILELKSEDINEYCNRGYLFMKNYWSGKKNIWRLINIYKDLL